MVAGSPQASAAVRAHGVGAPTSLLASAAVVRPPLPHPWHQSR
jgi:hypothetical protein